MTIVFVLMIQDLGWRSDANCFRPSIVRLRDIHFCFYFLFRLAFLFRPSIVCLGDICFRSLLLRFRLASPFDRALLAWVTEASNDRSKTSRIHKSKTK